MATFGERLTKIRELKNLSRIELGRLAELPSPRSRMSAYENDDRYPSREVLKKFSNVLKVSVEWLTTGKLDKMTINTIESIKSDDLDSTDDFRMREDVKPTTYFEFNSFLIKNNILLDRNISKETWGYIYFILRKEIKKKFNSVEMIEKFSPQEEYDEWLMLEAEEEEFRLLEQEEYERDLHQSGYYDTLKQEYEEQKYEEEQRRTEFEIEEPE